VYSGTLTDGDTDRHDFEIRGVNVHVYNDEGKRTQGWAYWNVLDFLQQVGAVDKEINALSALSGASADA
jgi:hypothetical protein